MNLIYTDDLNKVEYKDLQKWLEDFIEIYGEDICEDEMMLVNLDNEEIESKITIMTDKENNIWLFLYINNETAAYEVFEDSKVTGIGDKFLKMLLELKKSIKCVK